MTLMGLEFHREEGIGRRRMALFLNAHSSRRIHILTTGKPPKSGAGAVRSRTAPSLVHPVQSVRCPRWVPIENHMLLILGVVIVSIATVVLSGMRLSGGENAGALGWMSEQWLADHRASHSP